MANAVLVDVAALGILIRTAEPPRDNSRSVGKQEVM
jgi:hypothetical protein